jgi:hypothetical protein
MIMKFHDLKTQLAILEKVSRLKKIDVSELNIFINNFYFTQYGVSGRFVDELEYLKDIGAVEVAAYNYSITFKGLWLLHRETFKL